MPSKVALITGASSGIGRACAIELAVNGWSVVVSGRRAAELDETIRLAEERKGDKVGMLAVAGDLSDPEAVHALFEAVVDKYGQSEAGGGGGGPQPKRGAVTPPTTLPIPSQAV